MMRPPKLASQQADSSAITTKAESCRWSHHSGSNFPPRSRMSFCFASVQRKPVMASTCEVAAPAMRLGCPAPRRSCAAAPATPTAASPSPLLAVYPLGPRSRYPPPEAHQRLQLNLEGMPGMGARGSFRWWAARRMSASRICGPCTCTHRKICREEWMTRTVREWCASAHKEGELMHACSGVSLQYLKLGLI